MFLQTGFDDFKGFGAELLNNVKKAENGFAYLAQWIALDLKREQQVGIGQVGHVGNVLGLGHEFHGDNAAEINVNPDRECHRRCRDVDEHLEFKRPQLDHAIYFEVLLLLGQGEVDAGLRRTTGGTNLQRTNGKVVNGTGEDDAVGPDRCLLLLLLPYKGPVVFYLHSAFCIGNYIFVYTLPIKASSSNNN